MRDYNRIETKLGLFFIANQVFLGEREFEFDLTDDFRNLG